MFYDLLCTEVLGKLKIGYLLVYNGIQWSCFILIVVALLKLLRGGLGEDKLRKLEETMCKMV